MAFDGIFGVVQHLTNVLFFFQQVFSEQNRENVVNKERCLTLEENIADLESNLKERNNEWENEKRKYVSEIKRLRSQVVNDPSCF